jgi:hypothetical protein
MTGDHHGREAERAALLVRVMDEILGTHRYRNGLYLVVGRRIRGRRSYPSGGDLLS